VLRFLGLQHTLFLPVPPIWGSFSHCFSTIPMDCNTWLAKLCRVCVATFGVLVKVCVFSRSFLHGH
jgi:hypothetical protein